MAATSPSFSRGGSRAKSDLFLVDLRRRRAPLHVVWTFEKSMHQKRTGLFIKNVGRIDKIEALSQDEVRFVLADPNRIFLALMTSPTSGTRQRG